jgi:S1-C subfamily serine protease
MRPFPAIFAVLVLGLAAFAFGGFGMAGSASASTLDDVQKGTLMIYAGNDGFCSGTLIAPDLILSAAHCVDGGDEVNVRVQILDEKLENVLSEKLVYVKAVRTLKTWDVALFSPKGKENFVEAFGASVAVVDTASDDEAKALKLGDRVLAFGYPKTFQLQVTDGLFSGLKFLKGMDYEHPVYKISSPITGGNSGGGLYLTLADGSLKLVGVNVAGFRDVSFMNYAASHEAVNAVTKGFVAAEFMERAKNDKPGSGIDSK